MPVDGPLIYPRHYFYVCSVINFVLRIAWTLTISPSSLGVASGGGLDPLWFGTILAIVEVYRRAQWNIFRMAHEQQANAGQFRAVNYVPVVSANDRKSAAKDDDDDD